MKRSNRPTKTLTKQDIEALSYACFYSEKETHQAIVKELKRLSKT